MNIDLRVMDETAKDLRAQMKDVLTKKLGKPRKVDKTLDDLLKQMARRHKYMATMDFVPQLLQQIRDWKVMIQAPCDVRKAMLEGFQNDRI